MILLLTPVNSVSSCVTTAICFHSNSLTTSAIDPPMNSNDGMVRKKLLNLDRSTNSLAAAAKAIYSKREYELIIMCYILYIHISVYISNFRKCSIRPLHYALLV